MAAEFVEADGATRLKLVAFVGILALLILLERLTAPDPTRPVTDPQRAFKQMTDRLLLVTLVAAPFALAWSAYFVRLAIKIKRSGPWPPPGVRVAVRTQIRRGRRATEMWIAMLVLAGISLVVFLVVLFAWYVASHLVSQSTGGRGYHRHLVVYAQRDGRPALAYAGTFGSEAATLEELRQLVRTRQITEGEEF